MDFKPHSELEGMHSFLSPSNYHWLNDDEDKIIARYNKRQKAQRGTELHAWAHECIRLARLQPESGDIISQYINDGIRWRMRTEVILFFTLLAFGSVDAVRYDELKRVLRVSDLKTGTTIASFVQLECYAALFCLEYDLNPFEISIELRIYQGRQVKEVLADPDRIFHVMDRYKTANKIIEAYRKEL